MPIPVTLSHAEAAEVASALLSRRVTLRASIQSLVRSTTDACPHLVRQIEATLAVAHRCLNATELALVKLGHSAFEADRPKPSPDEPKPEEPAAADPEKEVM
jgi:hypothetical protein